MSQGDIQVGEWGFPIELVITDQDGVAVDVSGATTKQVILTRPNGTKITGAAIFTNTGSDGKIRYVTISTDIDMVGTWYAQAIVSSATWKHPSAVIPFTVRANL